TRHIPFAIPASLFHKINDGKLVKDVKLLKSRQTRLKEKVHSLSKDEFRQLKLISEDIDHIHSKEFKEKNNNEQSRVLESALDYFSFRQVGNDDVLLKDARKKILMARVTLPPNKTEWESLPQRP